MRRNFKEKRENNLRYFVVYCCHWRQKSWKPNWPFNLAVFSDNLLQCGNVSCIYLEILMWLYRYRYYGTKQIVRMENWTKIQYKSSHRKLEWRKKKGKNL